MKPLRVGIFVTHPVQYHVPMWCHLARRVDWNVEVFYFSRLGVEERTDPNFGVAFRWDNQLLDGYRSRFLADYGSDDFDLAEIPSARSFFASERFDCILLHGYTHRFARQICQGKQRNGYRIVLRGEFTDRRGQGTVKSLLRNAYLWWFYRQVDAFCYIGQDAREHLSGLRIEPSRMFFSPYCVDSEYFEAQRDAHSKEVCRRELGIRPGQTVFLFSGKMISRKQPQLLAELASRLANDDRFVLIMLGDGPLLSEMRQRLAPLVENNRVLLPGFVNQTGLAKYFRASDAFILPSQFDTWGVVVNEAMHFGLPCFISEAVGCGRDLVESGCTGEVFTHGDINHLEAMVKRNLDAPDELQRMGESALARIQGYTTARAAQGIMDAIEYCASIARR